MNNEPAFPCKSPMSNDLQGMSLRDYFAAKAMQQAYVHFSGEVEHTKHWTKEGIAVAAYAMADAMMKARGES